MKKIKYVNLANGAFYVFTKKFQKTCINKQSPKDIVRTFNKNLIKLSIYDSFFIDVGDIKSLKQTRKFQRNEK